MVICSRVSGGELKYLTENTAVANSKAENFRKLILKHQKILEYYLLNYRQIPQYENNKIN